jgi:putative phosphoserine phosphatase/1-acylglycerol-3-phosphate O-acyltransferase
VNTEDAMDRIYAAPKGPEIGAFFNYDGTIITGDPAGAYHAKRLRELKSWAGRHEAEVAARCSELFRAKTAGSLQTEVLDLVAAHQAMGHTLVLVSSASRFHVEPAARELEIEHVLCTPLATRAGVLTGEPEGRPLRGAGKAAAALEFARAHDIEIATSFCYSNDDEDLPFLAALGNPLAVSPQGALRREAVARGWPILDCVPRGRRPGAVDLARTAGFYGCWGVGFGAGLGVGLLNRSRRQVWEIGRTIGADVGLALAGVDIKIVSGHEHLYAARPCVAVFNHQSNVDGIAILKVLGEGCTGAAKKETKYVPGIGQLLQFGDFAFIDRRAASARAALEPCVARIRDQGLTLVAPEGTRSLSPRLGPFKKGAFHVAMQAGVPILPVVMRGAGAVQWRGSKAIRPGTVEVVVLPPVDTSSWRPETVARHADDVRAMFLNALARWPTRKEQT